MTTDEGYIKFHCDWQPGPPISDELFQAINPWRQKLYDHRLIGAYPDGVGFGNLSVRHGHDNPFIITGTATGVLPSLTPDHYTIVTSFDLDANRVSCRGPVRASSESLTHAALYQIDPAIQAVAHAHSHDLWQRLLHQIPTTDASVPYGTPEMAHEMTRLYRKTDLPRTRLLVMAGHPDGLISFGRDLAEAVNRLASHPTH